MINVKDFLLKNSVGVGTYALVSCNGNTEATWFTKYSFGDNCWFLESPCELHKLMIITEPIDDFCKKYMEQYIFLEEGENKEDYINEFVKPMIVDGFLYEIENFQCFPYLPECVDEIKIINEKECLNYLLKTKRVR